MIGWFTSNKVVEYIRSFLPHTTFGEARTASEDRAARERDAVRIWGEICGDEEILDDVANNVREEQQRRSSSPSPVSQPESFSPAKGYPDLSVNKYIDDLDQDRGVDRLCGREMVLKESEMGWSLGPGFSGRNSSSDE